MLRKNSIKKARDANRLPVIAALAGALLSRATRKENKKQAVNKYTKKSGKKVKAYTRKAR